MKKILKLLLIVSGSLFLLLIAFWFLYLSPPLPILQIGLPENAKNLPWDIEEGSKIYNQRIQSQYSDGMSAIELTKQLHKEGYEVLVVAKQEKEEGEPYCAITWWKVSFSEDGSQRVTSDMDSHSQICSKAEIMQKNYNEGTSLSKLIKQLRKDNFDVRMSANIKRNKFPCGITWGIDWIENNELKANDIKGTFRYNCI